MIEDLFNCELQKVGHAYVATEASGHENQQQTNEAFSDKWIAYDEEAFSEQETFFEFQKTWYLKLYGFEDEAALATFLQGQLTIVDAGCGLGYKAKWFADLAPESTVIGIDFSDAAFAAAKRYADQENLVFVKGDIADTHLKEGCIGYVSCDQVIHHTEDPQKTMIELSRVLKPGGELAVYVYAKKALPRELVDDHFRLRTKSVSKEDMWAFSEQLTELGKSLSALNVKVQVPDMPLLDIKGGEYDIQRFIYWNFLKCFWNEELGQATSVSTNYDWYAPSNAERYSKDQFLQMTANSGLTMRTLHGEEACHSGRFVKPADGCV